MRLLTPFGLATLHYCVVVISSAEELDSQFAVVTSLDGSEEHSEWKEMRTPVTVKYDEYLVVTPLDIPDASEFYRETKNTGMQK